MEGKRSKNGEFKNIFGSDRYHATAADVGLKSQHPLREFLRKSRAAGSSRGARVGARETAAGTARGATVEAVRNRHHGVTSERGVASLRPALRGVLRGVGDRAGHRRALPNALDSVGVSIGRRAARGRRAGRTSACWRSSVRPWTRDRRGAVTPFPSSWLPTGTPANPSRKSPAKPCCCGAEMRLHRKGHKRAGRGAAAVIVVSDEEELSPMSCAETRA